METETKKARYHQRRYDDEAISIIASMRVDSDILRKSFKPLQTQARRKQDLREEFDALLRPEGAHVIDTLLSHIQNLCSREQAYCRQKPSEGKVIQGLNDIMRQYAGHNVFIIPDRWRLVKRLFVLTQKCSPEVREKIAAYLNEMGITRKQWVQINKSKWFDDMTVALIKFFKDITHPQTCDDPRCRATHREAYEVTCAVLAVFYPCFGPSIEAVKKRELHSLK